MNPDYVMDPTEVKALRARLGYTQEKLARALGCSLAAVTKWEQGVSLPTGLYAKALRDLASAHPAEVKVAS